jgi:hypothetical protein
MPTPRKSIQELMLTGTYQRNKGRYQARLSVGTILNPIGRPPNHLSTNEKVTWAEIAKQAPPGLLTKSDRISLEIVTKMVVKMRTGVMKVSELSSLIAILGKFGMTPYGRSKMQLPEPPIPAAARTAEEKAWDDLAELDD